jgi:hypothetical protein
MQACVVVHLDPVLPPPDAAHHDVGQEHERGAPDHDQDQEIHELEVDRQGEDVEADIAAKLGVRESRPNEPFALVLSVLPLVAR